MSISVHANEHITTITLDRPDKLNAFAGTMREELLDALRMAESEKSCRVVVITGAGRAFCAGGDVDFMAGLQRNGNVDAFRKLLDAGREIVLQIANMPKPVIASINGVAAGAGCNLALALDYRLSSNGAKLGRTVVRLPLPPHWGRTSLFTWRVGSPRATEFLPT